MVATRKLIFKSAGLRAKLYVSLCFSYPRATLPPKGEKTPWRTFELAEKGPSEYTTTWDNSVGYCVPPLEHNYVKMKPGDSTVLTGSPPALIFTPPISIPGVDTMHVANQTSAATDIGLGYISGDMMSPVALWDKVPKGTILISGMTPILGAYIEVDGEKKEHPSSVDKFAPIWQQDLLSLGPVTTIIIMDSRDGWYSAVQYSTPEFTPSFPTIEVLNDNLQVQGKIYRATLAFSDADDIGAATSSICTQLSAQGYVPSVFIKRGDTEATLELTVPPGGSCHQAEVDLIACFENGVCAVLPPHIKAHGGELLQDRKVSGVAVWAPISPCNPEWSM